ncbi:proline--tRNA ligase [Pseudoxanthomonas broegbernensis]|uniref:Proline--tRNA ligase n=1 Tax=Pseudoxanthomonas broegbernensis TaxID=83619 RepID=A0A7V8K718_9GAMM|nr:proline--tRNA ligase [Pseudoxanthomonas broegbernensis]KAF1686598.1 proline--tRNA ligase [Pseudoxanthomonas broegbernensis]MBB6063653.1 prolyl-tRNA synthetase [Pseudoxanthomonas broegbernensis]
MRLSRFHLHTTKETPADAELVSHKLMLRAGMIRKLAAGLYTWSPLGLRVLRKVEAVVREEMDRAGAVELQLPTIQPRELWEETGRWEQFGGQLLKIKDRKEAEYCYSPTAEEAITDFARQELSSYRQLPVNFYQVHTKFRDEIRPRFGVMRAREFLMKDAYSFHTSDADLAREYENMKAAYTRVFTRLGLEFRAVQADSGAIGGDASQEFHVLAESGEDALAFSTGSDYAANVEAAQAAEPAPRAAAGEALRKIDTPTQKTCEEVAALMGIPLQRTVKSVAVMGSDGFVLALVRGDHMVNEIKLGKVAGLADYRPATEAEIAQHLGSEPGFLGPVAPRQAIRIVADREVAAMADFVVGANEAGFHIAGVNWGRDLPEPDVVADIRNVVAGDRAADGGAIRLARGIEVGHVFQLGRKYSEAMGFTVLDETGKAAVPAMGCYGIGVSRIVAAAIEQNHDEAGIVWPVPMAPWAVAVCVINPKKDAAVDAAAEALLDELRAAGIEAVLDDRGLRPGAMFADIELIGIPHRVVVSERGLAAGTFEYRARTAGEAEALDRTRLLERLRGA